VGEKPVDSSLKLHGRRIRVCFVALYAYSLFNRNSSFVFGGSEVRAWLFATALAKFPEFDVRAAVIDHGQGEVEIYDGVRLYKDPSIRPPAGSTRWENYWWLLRHHWRQRIGGMRPIRLGPAPVPGERTFMLDRADADIYVIIGVTNLTAELATYCRVRGKHLLVLAGSDGNFSETFYDGSLAQDTYGNLATACHYAIMNADRIVAQSDHQAAICWERFERRASVIRNPFDATNDWTSDHDGYVVWIGKSDRIKRPALALEVARAFPETRFVLVMNPSQRALHQRILDDAPPNVTFIEFLPLAEIETLISRAAVLLNTSRFEGFPNTFLQAGRHGVPVASLVVDPDSFLKSRRCGLCAGGTMEDLTAGLAQILQDPALRDEMASNIAAYVRHEHRPEDKVNALRSVLLQMVGRPSWRPVRPTNPSAKPVLA
jgi:glycosyltransferase involved in cell wall biosynthesis